ncbi:MAG: redoxin family protein [Planctomycetes bacterium]|nr:redoxin family protein [Planctomycetota bacterium]
MKPITLAVVALTLCTASTVVAQDKLIKIKPNYQDNQVKQETKAKSLTIGDKAPAIDITHWVKVAGEKVEEFEAGKVYVVEFWATWCGPCVRAMPHLSELQEKYADYDVKFISVSEESLEKVVSFLFQENKKDGKIQNDRIAYTLTTDPDKSVKKDYFLAAGQTGIPSAFIIGKDTRIEWIGNPGYPIGEFDAALEAVVKDTWDREESKTKFEAAMAKQRKATSQRQKFTEAMKDEEWAPAVEMSWDNANALNTIAWRIADSADVKNRDFKVALKAAKRANELTEEKNAAYLDTLARVYYETGNLKEALIWQRKAAEAVLEGSPMADGILEYLKKYVKEAGSDA